MCMLAVSLTSCGKDVSSREPDHGDSAVDASVASHTITAEVNYTYSAQKLGGLIQGSDGYTFEFTDGKTDVVFNTIGTSSVSLKATNPEGKEDTWVLNVNAIDSTSPVFNGIKNLTAEKGQKIDLKSGVTVEDNYDKKIDFTVSYDKDDTDPTAVGDHVVTYFAKDSSGNVASRKITLTITGEPDDSRKETTTTKTDDSSSQSETETSAATTTTKTTEPPQNGTSQNVKFYQDRIVIAGDSIAYGFCAYGFVPYEHNIAKGSTAMRNYTDTSLFMFDPTGTDLPMMDAIKAVRPSLLYISMGMNDVNLIDDATYTAKYKEFIQKVKQLVPDCVIVAATITPIAATSNFTDINKIRACNDGIKKLVAELNDPNVICFDAYSVIAGSDGMYAGPDTTGPDGIHLTGPCYQNLLDKLAVLLDAGGAKEKITEIESKR